MNKSPIVAIIVTIAVFSLGLGTGRALSPADDYRSRYENLRSKFEEIGQVDIEEYLQLKSLRERYQKADEILGKILLIMIADFGLRASKEQLHSLKNRVIDSSGGPNSSNSANIQPSAAARVTERPTEPAASHISGIGGVRPGPGAERKFVKVGAKANVISNENDMEEFLKTVEIPDFFSEIRARTPLSSKQASLLNGIFKGKIHLDPSEDNDPEEARIWDVEMETDGRFENGKFIGSSEIRMFRNGRRFSRSTSGQGSTLENFAAFAGDDSAMLLNVYGDDGFVQLYYFPLLNRFSGNYYGKKDIGQFEKRGRVSLLKN
jgi:hypothetical protein